VLRFSHSVSDLRRAETQQFCLISFLYIISSPPAATGGWPPMTTLMERSSAPPQQAYVNQPEAAPAQVIVATPGHYSPLEVAQAYFLLGERPIPLCDPQHAHVSPHHVNGYRRKNRSVAAPCTNPGKAPWSATTPGLLGNCQPGQISSACSAPTRATSAT
jgi:hypothetical protein